MTVDPASTSFSESKVKLESSVRYTLELTGTQNVTGPEGYGFQYDALYCYAGIGFDHPECSPPTHGGQLYLGTDRSKLSNADSFTVPGGPEFAHPAGYDPNHSYSLPFYPTSTDTLKAGGYDAQSQCKSAPNPCQDTVSGSYTIKIFGPATSQPPSGGGGGGAPSACDSSLRARLAKACGTADLPFGTAAVLPAPPPGVATDVSSGKLPAKTNEVDVEVQMTDAEIDRMLTVLAFLKSVWYEKRRKILNDAVGGCAVVYGAGSIVDEEGHPVYGNELAVMHACLVYIERSHLLDAKGARAAAGGCSSAIVPVWRTGSHPSLKAQRLAVTMFNSKISAKCARVGKGRLSLKFAARNRKATLNAVLGKHANTVFARTRPAGASDGPNPRMTVSWKNR